MRRVSPTQQFGNNVSRLRKGLGMTQEDLAYASGLHPTAISHIETGNRDTRFMNILKLAAALEVAPGELFAGVSLKR